MFHVEQCKMFHVEQYKMFHVEQCKINVPRETMHKGSCLGGRGQRRASAAAFRSSRRCFGFFGLRRQLSAPVGAASAASGSGGSFPLQSARLRLLRAPAAAFRSSRRGFGCFGLRWARVAAARRASSALRSWACSASVGGGQLRFASPPSAILRLAIPVAPFAFALLASAQPRRSALRCLRHCLPPLQAAAYALRCLRHCLPPLQAAASALRCLRHCLPPLQAAASAPPKTAKGACPHAASPCRLPRLLTSAPCRLPRLLTSAARQTPMCTPFPHVRRTAPTPPSLRRGSAAAPLRGGRLTPHKS